MANPLFDRVMAGSPDAVAVETDERRYTYADLERETARLANALVALGVAPGDRVAACVEKSAANLILYLAAVRAGAVWLPLNPAYTTSELAYFIADAGPALIVCDPAAEMAMTAIAGDGRVATLDAGGQGSVTDLAASRSDGFATVAQRPQDLAAICYTSGTTGRSKGAMLSQGNLFANALTLKELWRFTPGDRLIHALPLYHVHGLFVASHVVLMAGASMVLQPRFDAGAVLAAMPDATCLMGVPTFYTRLLAHSGLTREAVAGMRLFISGSAPLLASIHHAWRRRTGHAILERYGLTETGMDASNPYEGERIAGTVGPPLPDVCLRIADPENGQALPRGEIGGVEVKGPNVFCGYWQAPEKTAQAFRRDGFFITGDLGVIDERGYLSIVGRDKDLIITGGLNVYPREVEAVIDALPGVVESAVIGLEHADLGEAVTAVVAVGSGPAPAEGELLAAVKPGLAGYKQPKRAVFVEALPRNAMGKVQKTELRRRFAQLYRDVKASERRL
jgi:malonyl-CoA/methylmalonyl-CoA synthetase